MHLHAVGSLRAPDTVSLTKSDQDATSITDLPPAILAKLLCHVSSPKDVAGAAFSCHYLQSVAQSAPLRLAIRPRREDRDTSGAEESVVRANLATRAELAGVRATFSGTQQLDVAGCPVSDEDVAGVLASLRSLQRLVLDGCQKLTSAVADTLAVSVQSGPSAVSLQRCFRLGPAAACNLLAAAGARGSLLSCVLLSHLDRLDLPRDQHGDDITPEAAPGDFDATPALPPIEGICLARKAVGFGLRILALHNCGSLGAAELASVAATCPLLELLLLGGSGEGLGLCRPEACPPERVQVAAGHLARTCEVLPRLTILELTFYGSAVVAAVKEELKREGCASHSCELHVWDLCESASVADAVVMVKGRDFEAREVGYYSRQNQLFLRDPSEHPSSTSGPSPWRGIAGAGPVQSKSFSVDSDAVMGIRAAVNCSDVRRRTPLHVAAARADAGTVAGLLALGATAGGSEGLGGLGEGPRDSGGATALFLAAESGHSGAVRVLCRGGADVLVANRAGESPLYIAALRGHREAVQAMLDHCTATGVNWQHAAAYGDGWTPLMAAAVADRQDVARVLLQAAGAQSAVPLQPRPPHCILSPGKRHAPQTSPPSTPKGSSHEEHFDDDDLGRTFEQSSDLWEHELGGADEGSRGVDHGQTGLSGGEGGGQTGGFTGGLPLLDAQNRYGQTALHIAARRASVWFVVNLLSAGASPHVRDAYGMRPVDIAQRQGHTVIVEILRAWDAPPPVQLSLPTTGASKQESPQPCISVHKGSIHTKGKSEEVGGTGAVIGQAACVKSRGLLGSFRSRKSPAGSVNGGGSNRRVRSGMRRVWAPKQDGPETLDTVAQGSREPEGSRVCVDREAQATDCRR